MQNKNTRENYIVINSFSNKTGNTPQAPLVKTTFETSILIATKQIQGKINQFPNESGIHVVF